MSFVRVILIAMLCICPIGTWAGNSKARGDWLHRGWLDGRVSPATDFFAFANGGWQKRHPIPAAYSIWGVGSILQDQDDEAVRTILEAAAHSGAKAGSNEQKIGDFYASGMDEALIEREGVMPLAPELRRIARIGTPRDLEKEIARLQMIGVDAAFDFGQMQDYEDSSKVIGVAMQGGLGLPDRDYYLSGDPHSRRLRADYLAHVTRMFELLGDGAHQAAVEARAVLDIESSLARASISRVEARNPRAVYHMMDLGELERRMPDFSWSDYLAQAGHPEIRAINLGVPRFFAALDDDLRTVPLTDWRAYLRSRLMDTFAPYLSKRFVDEALRMQSAITGVHQLRPRWQRVIAEENRTLGFAIGKLYVERYFPPSSKRAVSAVLRSVRWALADDLRTLSWMMPATRAAALRKLSLMAAQIGYPDKWLDSSGLRIDRGPYVLNVMRANEFLQRRELDMIGKPVDRNQWFIPPTVAGAGYDSSLNTIIFTAAVLRPPFYNPQAPAAVNYGAIGWMMGHEMTHGFDDQGAKFDGHGNLRNWWTPEDKRKFQAATRCIAKQYSSYLVDGSIHLQGKLVTGEATADLGGLTLAWRAFHASPAYKAARSIDGLTPDQQFFLSAAHVWAINVRPTEARQRAMTDPHAPPRYRVNGTLADMPQFAQAFAAPPASPMVNPTRCVIW